MAEVSVPSPKSSAAPGVGKASGRPTALMAVVAIGGPIAVLFALVAALGFAFFRAVSLDHDATSRAADIAAMERSLEAAIETQRAMTHDYAHWDESFENTTLSWDDAFVRANFYSDFADAFVIVSQNRDVRYSWVHPRTGEEGADRVAAAMATLPRQLSRDAFQDDRTNDVAARSYIGLFKGAPLIVTVLPIHPETPELLERLGNPPNVDFLVSTRTFDLPQLAAIGRQIGLAEFRFSTTLDRDPGRASLALGQVGETPIGYVSWLDRRPGTQSFDRHIGVLLVGFALLSALAAIAILRSVRGSLRTSEAARVAAEAARREAERANAAKSQFLATMSHELRTPLNAIIGYSEILAENAGHDRRPDDARDAGRIVAAGHHLLSMINQILDHAAIEAGAITINPEAVSIVDIARDVVGMTDAMARNQATTLELVAEDTATSTWALADPIRLRQSLLNIVGNAVKFTRAGTVRVECRRERQDGRDWALFRVSDTGIGMSPETLARLFTPFMQADGSDSRAFEGTGLGLAITKRLIEGMHGRIEVTSTLGVGTTVTLRLPLAHERAFAIAA